MSTPPDIPAFGSVDQEGEHGILAVGSGAGAQCILTLVARTERGYPRRDLAAIPLATWRQVAPIVAKELVRGMDREETGPRAPAFRSGEQALSPLVARELAVILWALMEDGEGTHIDALLGGWRQLAREERWWLYARASNPSQRQGKGWRRALYYALTDPADTRTAPRLLEIMEAVSAQKKTAAPKRKISSYRQEMAKEKRREARRRASKDTASKKTAAKKQAAKTTPAKKTPRPRAEPPARKVASKKTAKKTAKTGRRK